MSTLVHYAVEGSVARLTLDSPHNRNALSTALVHQLHQGLTRRRPRTPRCGRSCSATPAARSARAPISREAAGRDPATWPSTGPAS